MQTVPGSEKNIIIVPSTFVALGGAAFPSPHDVACQSMPCAPATKVAGAAAALCNLGGRTTLAMAATPPLFGASRPEEKARGGRKVLLLPINSGYTLLHVGVHVFDQQSAQLHYTAQGGERSWLSI